MNTSEPLYPFRLALSYLKRVEDELAKWAELRSARKTEVSTFDHVRASYRAHHRKAIQVVEDFRTKAKAEIEPLEEEIRLQNRARRKLIEQASVGGVPPQEANTRNRELSSQIAEIEARLATARTIIEAASVGDVGGYVSLPVKEYEKKLVVREALPEVVMPRHTIIPPSWIAYAAIAVLVLVVAYALLGRATAAKPVFRAVLLETDSAMVRVSLGNEGGRELEVYVPWPEGNPQAPGASSSSCGILLYAVERDGGTAKLVPNSEGCWRYRGVYLIDSGPITVRPGLASDLLLDTNKLRELGVQASMVRLVYTRRGGRELGHFETVLE